MCFIIMPIGSKENYPEGHFKRVYDFLIKPAVIKAGFIPIRADDVISTNHIVLDILKKIINSEMALCDLSSQNPNVLYELGIRQSFNKPITLIKDNKTERIFDIQGFRDLEYDSELRIDKIQEQIDILADLILNTYNNAKDEINSLVKLLAIEPAEITEKTRISLDTELILNSINELSSRIGNIEINAKPLKDFNYVDNINELELLSIQEMRTLKNGDEVYHTKFGFGTFLSIDDRDVMKIKFHEDIKKIMGNFVKLYKKP